MVNFPLGVFPKKLQCNAVLIVSKFNLVPKIKMKYRQLGKNGPTVSAIGYGAMVLSPGIYNPVEEEESLTTIERVFDLSINFVDTADIYGQGSQRKTYRRRDPRGNG